MTMPNAGFAPGGQRGYQAAGPGYAEATAQANGQPVTQLGMPAQQQMPQGMMGQEGVSPLSQTPPYVSQQGIRPQQQPQQQQPSPQYNPNQPYQYNTPQVGQPQQLTQDPLQQRIYDPRVPAELQGKSVAELIAMNHGLRQLHLQNASALPQTQPVPQAQPATAATLPADAPKPFNWQRPDESIGRIVEEKIGAALESKIAPMLRPMQEQSQISSMQNARNTIASEIPNFAQIEPLVLQRLQGMPASALSDPDTWRVGARLVLGDLVLASPRQQQQQVQGQPQQFQGQYPQNGQGQGQQFAPQQVGWGQQPVPNMNGFQSFYSEQPNQGGPGPQGPQLTPAQRGAAAAMNMTDADYAAWSAGVPSQPMGGRR